MKYKKLVLIMLFILLTVTGCFVKAPGKLPENNNSIPVPVEPEPAPEPPVDPIKEQIAEMSIQEKLGQMVVVGLDGYVIDENTSTLIEKYKVGGFILFKQNVQSPEQLLNLINSLKGANTKNRIPLFVSVDEEGGRVSRMPSELLRLPTNKAIGLKNNEVFSFGIGEVLAKELSSFGFNMNFAPVLDINSNPKNPVIGDRSFGNNPELVSTLGLQTMKGMQAGSVIPVVKHFPGHGDTSVDSHVGLPVVKHDMDSLMSFELIPFKAAINNKADGVMVAHLLMEKIDPEIPASLSPIIITELLREQLGYEGVVITDDMTMGSIMKNYEIGDAAVKSVTAGTDIILVCHGFENKLAVMEAMLQAVENKTITEERLNESVYRILKLKEKYKLQDMEIPEVNVDEINSRIDNLLNKK